MATKKELAAAKAAKVKEEKEKKAAAKKAEKEAKDAKKKADKEAKDAAALAKKGGAKKEVEHRHISELNKLDRDNLEAILRKEPGALDEEEQATLSARAAYLSSDERKKFKV